MKMLAALIVALAGLGSFGFGVSGLVLCHSRLSGFTGWNAERRGFVNRAAWLFTIVGSAAVTALAVEAGR